MGKKSKRRPNTLRIKRDVTGGSGAGVSPEQVCIMWLRKERELITPEGSLRRAATIDNEVGVYYSLALAHIKDPAGRNDSRAEFYFRKVADIANSGRIGFSVCSVRESFVKLFRLYIEAERSKEASTLLKNFLAKECGRDSFSRKDSAESYVLYQCIGIIVTSNLSDIRMAPLIPVLEKYMETLDGMGVDALHSFYLAMNTYFADAHFYSKALTYAKKRLHAIQRSPENRYGKLEFRAVSELAENYRLLGMHKDALSQLEIAERIIAPNEEHSGIRDKHVCGAMEQSIVYELFGDTLKEQAQVTKTKDLRKELDEKSISYFKKASKIRYDLLDQSDRNGGADTDDFLSPAIRISLKLGRQLANNKKWAHAKKYYMLGVEMAERDVNDLTSMTMIYQDLGKVFLDQYLDPNYFSLEGEEAELLLNSAVEYTQKGVTALMNMSPVPVLAQMLLPQPISFDIAVESYFLGKKDEACQILATHLIALTVDKSCAGCGHANKGAEAVKTVKTKCASCNACYYCDDICQHRHWKNVDDKRKSHKRLCPLLKEVKGSNIDDICDRLKFEGINSLREKIVDYFEGLKPSREREKDSRGIDSVD